MVEADAIDAFKKRLDNYWSNLDVFNLGRVEIKGPSRSGLYRHFMIGPIVIAV